MGRRNRHDKATQERAELVRWSQIEDELALMEPGHDTEINAKGTLRGP